VNYRGSSGYGLAFENLGKKQWAKGIEDDIDAAVEHAMGLSTIDADRVCIIGGSYGGFSALASIVRHRDRYRCAVTMSGVTDVPLMADSSDMADSRFAMEYFQEYVGDLETEREKLIEISPAYQTERMAVPILIVQGTVDRRVDPDHAHRLVAMLQLRDKPYEAMFVEGAGHGFDADQWPLVAIRLRRFLSRHLRPEVGFRGDPVAAEKSGEFGWPGGRGESR
jgi:dipeptidyl aminopeptidase/acylaminoacyl peptidase